MKANEQATSRCDYTRLLLDDYVDGNLAPLVEREVKSHLVSCSSCAEEAERLKKISDELSRLGTTTTDEVLLVVKKVQKAVRKDGRWCKKRRLKIAGAVAASIAALLLWSTYFRPGPVSFEINGKDIAFHAMEKTVVVDASRLPGDLTVIGGDVYVTGEIEGNVTSIDGRIVAKVEDGSVLSRVKRALIEIWQRIWR